MSERSVMPAPPVAGAGRHLVSSPPVPDDGSTALLAIAEALRVVARRSAGDGGRSPLEELVLATREQISTASTVSVTVLRSGRFRTEASTDEVALRADALQYEIGSGPCVDAVLDDSIYVTQDVALDERWAQWGRRVSREVGLRSVLAYRLAMLDDAGTIAALNVYSDRVGAFDDRDLGTGLVLATHGSLLVTAQLARDKAENLLVAMESNREIGMAMGILMQRHQLDRDQAFAVLRVASQDSNRKLADIAREVADTGVLAIKRWPVSAAQQPSGR